jgi:hypothetical protein
MHINVRLSPRKLEPVVVCGHDSVGKLSSFQAAAQRIDRAPAALIPAFFINDTDDQGLQSFMTEDSDAVGSIRSSVAQRTFFALDSLNFNMRDK